MKKFVYIVMFSIVFLACKKEQKKHLFFLDEFVLDHKTTFQNEKIGGLSGIDFYNNSYYFVIDDGRNPRFLTGNISIEKDTIKSISFNNVVHLNDSTQSFYRKNVLDLESIFVDFEGNINLISEGSIKYQKRPKIFKTTKKGIFLSSFKLPKSFNKTSNIRHNGVFEGSSKSIDNLGFWVAMETPLKQDGEEATFTTTNSPTRITFFDYQTEKATQQFAYQLEKIDKPAKGKFNINGITAILEHRENHFLVVERTYQSGYGAHGNVVRIFEASINEKTTNILDVDSLKSNTIIPLKKRFLFDFSTVKNQLTNGIIDNIEGITFGPKLANGHQSIILISDDNFQNFGKQLNQFILMELIP